MITHCVQAYKPGGAKVGLECRTIDAVAYQIGHIFSAVCPELQYWEKDMKQPCSYTKHHIYNRDGDDLFHLKEMSYEE